MKKIYLIRTDSQARYRMLYESVVQIISNGETFEMIDLCQDADCIVCIGDLTQEIKGFKRQEKTTIVRFLFNSDISRHFYTDITLVDYTFWVRDLDINILCPYQQTSEKIAVPFDFAPAESDKCDAAKGFDIYVNTSEFLYANSALFKILRTLNRLTQLRIKVCSRNENIRNLANANIGIADSYDNIENHVKRSKMVIGSGYAILFAIKHHKPFIVLGERGYGGIPTPNNIVEFYHEFFQGPIGGRLDGPLPENLVYEDIVDIRNGKVLPDFTRVLSQEIVEIKDRIIKQILLITSQKEITDATKLRFNTDYTIIQGNGKSWLLNRFTRCIAKRLSDFECEILQAVLRKDKSICEIFQKQNIIVQAFVEDKVLIVE